MSVGPARRGPRVPGGTGAWWAVLVGGRLLCVAAGVVLAAYLWPVALGGCTSFVTVPADGSGLVAGDVLVTRCGAPGVGDRVVHRAADGAWGVARVVAPGADGWHLRAEDGPARTFATTRDLGGVLAARVDAPATAVGGTGLVTVLVLATVAGRSLRAAFAA